MANNVEMIKAAIAKKNPQAAALVEQAIELGKAVGEDQDEIIDAFCQMRGEPMIKARYDGDCRPLYYQEIVKAFAEACGKVPPCNYVEAILEVIDETSFVAVEDQLGTDELNMYPSGITGSGKTVDGRNDTEFVADFPVGAGQSIVLFTEQFDMPWFPGCVDLDLQWDEGDIEANYARIRAAFFYVDKGNNSFSTVNPQPDPPGPSGWTTQGGAIPWNKRKIYRGKKFRCGTKCSSVPIIGRAGCAGQDMVGRQGLLAMQIDNGGTGSNDISNGTAVISFFGFQEPCCDTCAGGMKCGCGGGKH